MHAMLTPTQWITDWFDENQIRLNDTWLQAFRHKSSPTKPIRSSIDDSEFHHFTLSLRQFQSRHHFNLTSTIPKSNISFWRFTLNIGYSTFEYSKSRGFTLSIGYWLFTIDHAKVHIIPLQHRLWQSPAFHFDISFYHRLFQSRHHFNLASTIPNSIILLFTLLHPSWTSPCIEIERGKTETIITSSMYTAN